MPAHTRNQNREVQIRLIPVKLIIILNYALLLASIGVLVEVIWSWKCITLETSKVRASRTCRGMETFQTDTKWSPVACSKIAQNNSHRLLLIIYEFKQLNLSNDQIDDVNVSLGNIKHNNPDFAIYIRILCIRWIFLFQCNPKYAFWVNVYSNSTEQFLTLRKASIWQ